MMVGAGACSIGAEMSGSANGVKGARGIGSSGGVISWSVSGLRSISGSSWGSRLDGVWYCW